MWQVVGGDWGEIDFKRNGPGCDLAVCGDGFNWITQPSRGVWRCHTCRQNTGDVLSTANCSDSTVWSHMTVGCYASVTILMLIALKIHFFDFVNFVRCEDVLNRQMCGMLAVVTP